jgi:acyl carrier protein
MRPSPAGMAAGRRGAHATKRTRPRRTRKVCPRPAVIIARESRHATDEGDGMSTAVGMTGEERALAELIVEALNLDTRAEDIDPSAPLYHEGLGLDSIDILEIALTVSKRYGMQLRSDDEDNARIFASLRSLSEHVQRHRTR